MKLINCILFLWFSPFAVAALVPKSTKLPRAETSRGSRFDRFVQKIFDDADTDLDDFVSFNEAYELVLKMYVQINRQAPIPPPSRAKVLQLYIQADKTHDKHLNRDEFRELARVLGRRAMSRLVAHKIVTLFGAPLLAEYLVRTLATKNWVRDLADVIVPNRFHERILPVITSITFCRTVLVVLSVMTLGNIVLSLMNWVLDMSLSDENIDPKLSKKYTRF